MPNDCYNYLEAPDGDVSLIADYISTRKVKYSKLPEVFLDFRKVVPIPEGETNDSWAIQNWGTKANSYDGTVLENGIGFYTAWSPPTPVIVELAKKTGHTLRMTYDEPGMDFCGEFFAYPDGKYADEQYSPRSDAPEDLKEELSIEDNE